MKPWEDKTLLQMIVFAQQNPDCDLAPLRDRIQEMEYTPSQLRIYVGPLCDALIRNGYQDGFTVPYDWIDIREKMGIWTGDSDNLAIPFPDPQ